MARRFPRPDISTPLIAADGKTMNQAWFDWCGYVDRQIAGGLGGQVDVSTTAPTNGQVLIFNSTTKLWVPGAN